MKYTEDDINHLIGCREEGMTWREISENSSKMFGEFLTPENLRASYKYHSLKLELGTEEVDLTSLRRERSARKSATIANKRLRVALDGIEKLDEVKEMVLEGFANLVEDLEPIEIPEFEYKGSEEKIPMTLELMLSDLHFGKKTEAFNEEIARDRMHQIYTEVVREIRLHSDRYFIDEIVILLMGDIIESATMHGEESRAGVEYGNSMQVVAAIDIIANGIIIPLSSNGYSIKVKCIPGNHDRESKSKTYVNRGQEFLSYVIYKGIESLTSALGLPVEYDISEGTYLVYDIYGTKILLEHGDEIKSTAKTSFEVRIAQRQKQVGHMIHGIRVGHTHEYTMYDRGRVIINGCLCGQDGYSDILGYDTGALQVLNFYCPTDERPTSFYKTFPIYLT